MRLERGLGSELGVTSNEVRLALLLRSVSAGLVYTERSMYLPGKVFTLGKAFGLICDAFLTFLDLKSLAGPFWL